MSHESTQKCMFFNFFLSRESLGNDQNEKEKREKNAVPRVRLGLIGVQCVW